MKKYRPITNGRRDMTSLDFAEITKATPEELLLKSLSKKARCNNQGKLTIRRHGGGYKHRYHVTDLKHNKDGINAKADSIRYDPNRPADIVLVAYAGDGKRYTIAPKGLEVGQIIESGAGADIEVSNALPLQDTPVGIVVHNAELKPGKGGQIARPAGISAQAFGKEDKYVLIRLKSGGAHMILSTYRATIGQVGDLQHESVDVDRAGRSRWKGICPTICGSVMNPNDHPHGGGEGRALVGRSSPMSPWGGPTLGKKTRHSKKSSNKLIVRERKKK